MLAKLRAKLSFANVVSVAALFVALGGSAYAVTALDRNSVRSKHIVNGQVKGADVKEASLQRICPDNLLRINDLCFEQSDRAPLQWEIALRTCAATGFRLPTLAEAVLMLSNVTRPPDTTVIYWASEWEPADGNSPATIVEDINDGGNQFVALVATAKTSTHTYRCVTSAR